MKALLKSLSADNFSNIFSRQFYYFALTGAMVLLMFTFFVVPVVGEFLSVFSFVAFAYMLVEHIIAGNFTVEQYKNRYSATIYVAVFVNTVATFFLHKDYMFFIPVILSILYLNVNSLLQRKGVYVVTALFMLSPVVKIIFMKRDLEYAAILVLFTLSIMLSDVLFRGKAQAISESERRRELMREVFKLMNNLTVHDVRNVLQRMQTLALPKYRTDTMVFLEQLEGYTEEIDRLVDARLFDTLKEVDVDNVVKMLSNLTNSKHIQFEFVNDGMLPKKCNRRMLYATLKNLIENAVEASARQRITGNLKLTATNVALTLVDDCGGFDISKIAYGNTSKNDKQETHGVFLRTILDPSLEGMFGFRVTLENIGTGTKSTLTFDENTNNLEALGG